MLHGDVNGEANTCGDVKKGVQDDAGMKVMEMTDGMVRDMIARIQKAGNTLTSDRLRMVIAKSLEDENEAENVERGGADEGDPRARTRHSGTRMTTC